MPYERALVLAAALATALPAPAQGRIIWVDLCDAVHEARKIPLPIDDDERRGPGQAACHAACGLLPDRRGRR